MSPNISHIISLASVEAAELSESEMKIDISESVMNYNVRETFRGFLNDRLKNNVIGDGEAND